MDIDTNLMLTITAGVLLGSLAKHAVLVGLNAIGLLGSLAKHAILAGLNLMCSTIRPYRDR